MKVKELIKALKQCDPNRHIIFWNGEDNIDVDYCYEDECNNEDVILGQKEL
tara:strand:+ start:1473 stop:1625 length:153 start_codon:yes stop_codon:yes gene_type:complete